MTMNELKAKKFHAGEYMLGSSTALTYQKLQPDWEWKKKVLGKSQWILGSFLSTGSLVAGINYKVRWTVQVFPKYLSQPKYKLLSSV